MTAAWVTPEPVRWFAETGPLVVRDGTAVLRGVAFRLETEPETEFRAWLYCGGETRPRPLCRISGKTPGAVYAPVNTPRCHSFRLRFSGRGGCTLSAVTLIAERTGEVRTDGR